LRYSRLALNQLDDAKLGEAVTITFGANSRIVVRGEAPEQWGRHETTPLPFF